MNLPSPVDCGLDSHYLHLSLADVDRITFIRGDGAAERVSDGHLLVHDAADAAIVIWRRDSLSRLPDWVRPERGGSVDSIVAASSSGSVEASFSVGRATRTPGHLGAVFLGYEA